MRALPPAIAAFCSCLILTAAADTFELKDGTKLEGKILREDATSYVLEVQVTRTIKDERVVPKDEVVAIHRETADLKEFEKIAALVPVPDMLTAEQYASRIRSVEKFLAAHPSSGKSRDARKILETLKTEANEILAGSVKISGKFIPPAEYSNNQLEIDARMQELRIREVIGQGHLLTALRAFIAFDQQFAGTQPHAELLPLIIQAINSHLAETKQLLATFDSRAQQRQAGLDRMAPDSRRATADAIAEETANIQRRFEAEKAAKIGWVTIAPYFRPSLEETLTFGQQELTRLRATSSTPPADKGKVFRDTLSKIRGTSDATTVTQALSEARNAGIPQKYLDILDAAATAAKPTP